MVACDVTDGTLDVSPEMALSPKDGLLCLIAASIAVSPSPSLSSMIFVVNKEGHKSNLYCQMKTRHCKIVLSVLRPCFT